MGFGNHSIFKCEALDVLCLDDNNISNQYIFDFFQSHNQKHIQDMGHKPIPTLCILAKMFWIIATE